MNVTAVHTGTALPLTLYGLYRHSPRIFDWIFASYAANPVDFTMVTPLMSPPTVRHSLNEPITRSFPDRWISVFVTSSGTMFLSPAMREPSSNVGGTICGGAGGGGGGGGGGGAPTTPPTTPPATPPSSPPTSPLGSPLSSVCGATSCFSILTGWTMSRTLIFFGWIWTSCGFAPPGGGGGGGGGGGATAGPIVVFGGSGCSRSQIVLIHMNKNSPMWNTTTAINTGPAHGGALRFLAASKLPNMWPVSGAGGFGSR